MKKPDQRDLMFSLAACSDYFEHSANIISTMPYRQKVGLFQFYKNTFNDDTNLLTTLTNKQRTYYQLEK